LHQIKNNEGSNSADIDSSMKIKYSQGLLAPIVKNSLSVAEVIRKLGLKQAGGNHSHITRRIKLYGLDTSHFVSPKANLKHGVNKLPPDQILVNDRLQGRRDGAYILRRALLESGIEHKCVVCDLPPFWNGQYLQLQVDHINGIITDNRIENLRFICGNCHLQTENFGIKNSTAYLNREIIIKPLKPLKLIKEVKPKPSEINPDWRHQPKLNTRKVERPSKEELEKLLWENPTAQLAKQFGVSDNAIAKWAKLYGITKPSRGYWAKQRLLDREK
jgi:5-methylcytosine-specific restriction endonuclease McrA